MDSNKKLPRYFIVGIRAVKLIETNNGKNVGVFVYDEKIKDFVRNIDFLSRVYESSESEEVTEEEFNAYVEKLKNGEI